MIIKFFKKIMSKFFYFIERNKRIVLALFSLIFAFVLGLSLYSFNKYDESWFYYSTKNSMIKNIFGFFGSNISSLFFYLFDAAAYAFIPFFLYTAYLLFFKVDFKQQVEKFFSLLFLPFILSGILSFKKYSFFGLSCNFCTGFSGYFGGVIGNYTKVFCLNIFDKYTGLIFMYVIFCAALVLIFRKTTKYLLYFSFKSISFICSKAFLIPAYKYLGVALRAIVWPFVYVYNFLKNLFSGYDFISKKSSVLNLENYKVDNLCEKDFEELREMLSKASLWDNDKNFDKNFDCASCDSIEDFKEFLSLQQDSTGENKFNVKNLECDVSGKDYNKNKKEFNLPDYTLFDYKNKKQDEDAKQVFMQELKASSKILEEKLEMFGVSGKVVSIKRGPVVTLFEYNPKADSKISKILALSDDLALALKAVSIRIIAPIPGKSLVGFEVSNQRRDDVLFSEIVNSQDFKDFNGSLPLILGKDTIGSNIVVDLAKMPHLLIAGSTGSGKSVALNALLVSLLCKLKPDDLKLILIDPKRLEFSAYEDIAHLVFPIVTDTKKVVPVLKWAVREMEERYQKMADMGVKNIFDYNSKIGKADEKNCLMPNLVIMIDELADLMMTVGKDLEGQIARIAQMARAAGIHMIVATQRPSVDVITGIIKVNFPSRISFRVTSKVDSRTILDCCGAEKLLGKGDMLLLGASSAFLSRLHGAYVSNEEIERVVEHIKKEAVAEYIDLPISLIDDCCKDVDLDDDLYDDIRSFIGTIDEVSISLLQRKFRIGYNRSARIIEKLELEGLVLPSDGSKMRKVVR